MAKTFRLVQISDCHLAADPQSSYRGKNADAGLRALAEKVAAWQPDLVLATGDLSEDASDASYQRLQDYFGRIGAPVWALPGNHDNPALMQKYFPVGPWHGPRTVRAGDWCVAMLDSAVAGRVDGAISDIHLQALRRQLQRQSNRPALLALHHQPVPVGSAWIDRYMLKAPESLLELVAGDDGIRAVVWGHVHQHFESMRAGARLLACPSSAANSVSGTPVFVEDPAGPACRWLELRDQGRLETGVLYAMPQKDQFGGGAGFA